jgi:hypothetical protein
VSNDRSRSHSEQSLFGLVLVLIFFVAGQVRGEGLDLRNPTPRAITVSFENSGPRAPGALDQQYGEPVRGFFVPGPGEDQALVRIPGAEMERVVSHYEPVPGSFSDFVWIFDTITGHVVNASFAGVVKSKIDWGFFDSEVETSIVMDLGTRNTGGFLAPVERLGHVIYGFCEEVAQDCRQIPPAPLDADTGYVNAVGSVVATAIGGLETTSYSPMGEAMFQESHTPARVSAGP